MYNGWCSQSLTHSLTWTHIHINILSHTHTLTHTYSHFVFHPGSYLGSECVRVALESGGNGFLAEILVRDVVQTGCVCVCVIARCCVCVSVCV
jgi:hypothetical protein